MSSQRRSLGGVTRAASHAITSSNSEPATRDALAERTCCNGGRRMAAPFSRRLLVASAVARRAASQDGGGARTAAASQKRSKKKIDTEEIRTLACRDNGRFVRLTFPYIAIAGTSEPKIDLTPWFDGLTSFNHSATVSFSVALMREQSCDNCWES